MYGFLFLFSFSPVYFLSSCQRTQLAIIYSSIYIYLFCVRCICSYLFRIPSIVETDTNPQLLIKLNQNENRELITTTNPMSTEYLINEQQNCSTTNELSSKIIHINGHNDPLTSPNINNEKKNPICQPTTSDQTNET
jgi:hypothetical protein